MLDDDTPGPMRPAHASDRSGQKGLWCWLLFRALLRGSRDTDVVGAQGQAGPPAACCDQSISRAGFPPPRSSRTRTPCRPDLTASPGPRSTSPQCGGVPGDGDAGASGPNDRGRRGDEVFISCRHWSAPAVRRVPGRDRVAAALPAVPPGRVRGHAPRRTVRHLLGRRRPRRRPHHVRWQITEQIYRKARAAQMQGRHAEYRSKPKTRAGEDRVVDLDAISTKVLRTWQKTQAAERDAWGSDYAEPADVGESELGAKQPERFAGSARDPEVRSPTIPQQIARPTTSIDQIDP